MSVSFSPLSASQTRPIRTGQVRPTQFAQVNGVTLPAVAPMFGAAGRSVRQRYVLLPSGTPIYFLHGTSSTGKRLNPLVNWFKREVRSDHPGYVSYLPEVQDATGIETVANPAKTIPSMLVAIREVGEFRLQLIHNRLQALDNALSGTEPGTPERTRAIARFFQLRPEMQDVLVPVLEKTLLAALDQMPAPWRERLGGSLRTQVREGMRKIRDELNKLHLRPDERKMPVYDSDFLISRAEVEGKKVNYDMNRPSSDPEVINVRPMHLREIALMEATLMAMEDDLTQALETVFADDPTSQGGPQRRARLTAQKFMDAVAPRVVTIGHSQGGTVLMAALINHLKQNPEHAEAFLNRDPRQFQALGARGIGMGVFLSTPLKGIPEVPVWGKKLQDWLDEAQKQVPLLNRRKHTFSELVKRYIWWVRTKDSPAVTEMRAGSPLMKKIEAELPNLAGRGITVISAFDKNDAYVEPAASMLLDATGRHPINVFNLELETPALPPYFSKPEELLAEFISVIPVIGPLLTRLIPNSLKRHIQHFYENDLISVEQHRALITLPHAISQEIGQQLIAVPDNQVKALDPGNFEPFRYQSLIARGKSFQRRCLDKPLREAAAVLYEFTRQHPGFLAVLIENARENVPVTNSASYQAQEMLTKTTRLMAQMVEDNYVRHKYKTVLSRNLQLLAEANLAPFTPDQESLSEQARRLLDRL